LRRGYTMRFYLDTCVVNLLVKESDFFDGGDAQTSAEQQLEDLSALRHVMQVAARGCMPILVSPLVLEEITGTQDGAVRKALYSYAYEMWGWWNETFEHADDDPGQRLPLASIYRNFGERGLRTLRDECDRWLVCDAVNRECTHFVTCDRSTILRHRPKLSALPLRFVSPVEWDEIVLRHI